MTLWTEQKQGETFAVPLTDSMVYDRLHTLSVEYSLPIEQLATIAVKRFLEDVELIRALRSGRIAGG